MAPLVILHLSDIHFSRLEGAEILLDYDADIRNELERDATIVRDQIGVFDAIVVTGDIAFSGNDKEYKKAADWLARLCDLLGCPPSMVWTTPGNHDVDRKAISNSPTLQMYHERLRRAGVENLDGVIRELTRDPAYQELIFRPMAAYNAFAVAFECAVSPLSPFWERDLLLNDGSRLRMRGLTSTFVSDDQDTNGDYKLVLGRMQTDLQRYDGVEYMTLCHHPPDWLIDGDQVHSRLVARAKIQLFGHKHTYRIETINHSLRIAAGATHPSQNEPNWIPRYNVLAIQVATTESIRSLVVSVYPRVWHAQHHKFMADYDEAGKDHSEFLFPLGSWDPPGPTAIPVAPIGDNDSSESQHAGPSGVVVHGDIDLTEARRLLNYRFWRLPFHRRISIAEHLGLLRDEDNDRPEVELFTEVFRRAANADRLAELWNEVEKMRDPHPLETNPFDRR